MLLALVHLLFSFLNVADVGKTLGFEANSQERILETPLVQKGDFIKAWGWDPWAERVALGS